MGRRVSGAFFLIQNVFLKVGFGYFGSLSGASAPSAEWPTIINCLGLSAVLYPGGELTCHGCSSQLL